MPFIEVRLIETPPMMHKIRLYVVPEQEELTDNDEDDIDLPPLLHRRNSRRPGAVRVIQKSVTTKCEPDHNRNLKGLEAIKELQKKKRNFTNYAPPKPPLRDSSLSNGRVIASPRIRKIANDLQQKMHQSSSRKVEHSRKIVDGSKVMVKNLRIERTGISTAGYKRTAQKETSYCRKDQYQTGHSPKIVRVKDQVDGMENRDGIGNSNDANLAILGRNNKLNGYRVSIFLTVECTEYMVKFIFIHGLSENWD